MEIAEHITIVEREGRLLAAAADHGGLDIPIEHCPGWDVRELVRHQGMIHLWAAGHVAKLQDESWGSDLTEFTKLWPDLGVFWPDDEKLIDWYLETNANLVNTLESAPLDVESWTFLPAPSPLAMWARRQAHETAVHRFDGENAAGIDTEFDPTFAADGIDELVAGFAPRKQEFPVDHDQVMQVHATDTDDHWRVTMAPNGITTTRDDGPGDVTLSGLAADLYLVLWNRRDDATLAVAGDHDLLEKWHGNLRVRWS